MPAADKRASIELLAPTAIKLWTVEGKDLLGGWLRPDTLPGVAQLIKARKI
jgi:hypothetical protein